MRSAASFPTVLVSLATLTMGCFTIAGDRLEAIDPPSATNAGFVEYTVGDFAYTVEGGKMITSNKAGRMTTDQLLERWKDHGYIDDFSYVKEGAFTGKADYNLTLSGGQYGEAPIPLQILSGLTLLLIPAYGQMNYDLQYTVDNVETGARYSAAVDEFYTQWMQLFLLFALPFADDGANAMEEKMALHLYEQLLEQHAFGAAEGADGGRVGRARTAMEEGIGLWRRRSPGAAVHAPSR